MIVVFWLQGPAPQEAEATSRHRVFGNGELTAALRFAEELRARRAGGEAITHVTIQSELQESVGRPGVADPDPGYNHYKRRQDPAIPLGRPVTSVWEIEV
jgi:hypothetical protein